LRDFSRTAQWSTPNGINRFLGIIPGAIMGYLYAVIFSAIFLALPIRDGLTEKVRTSQLGTQLAMQSEWANRKLAPVFDEAIGKRSIA
jgi:hypothetical protein